MTKKTHENMFKITSHQGNANKNHNELSTHKCKNDNHQKSTDNKYWRGCGEKETFPNYCWEWKLVQALWRKLCIILKNTKNRITISSNPTNGHISE